MRNPIKVNLARDSFLKIFFFNFPPISWLSYSQSSHLRYNVMHRLNIDTQQYKYEEETNIQFDYST